ncbi:MAG TPA: hypothetical protein ENN46_02700 [Candidatus Woesearchaeota archaeon]|nr:hypothetical protein [Candidatus Woesearchaeota archaeon]
MAKKKVLKYVLNRRRREKTFLVPERAINLKLETPRPSRSKGKNIVKVSYAPSRKEGVKRRVKLVTVPKGAETIRLA